ncbi:MAG: hypothetical protein AAFV53_01825 [Myxococcota bacterium]
MTTNALGFCEDRFKPMEPGRLCRGRERWIDAYPLKDPEDLFRVVISGAVFSDDSANDARRGLIFSGLVLHEVIHAVFPNGPLYAWAENAPPRLIPDEATGVEEYSVSQPGGPIRRWLCRWMMPCSTPTDIQKAIDCGADVFISLKADVEQPGPIAPPFTEESHEMPRLADEPDRPAPTLSEGLRQRLYLLTGFREGEQPTRRFQPGALPELLEYVEVAVLVHQDKHAPCLGMYSRDLIDPAGALKALCKGKGVLAVPFAIPPMLARWDRALWELRQEWDENTDGPFPVEPAPEGVHSWGRRHGRRRRKRTHGSGEE